MSGSKSVVALKILTAVEYIMIEAFLKYLQSERHYSEHTVSAYRRDLYDFCRQLGVSPEQLNPQQIDEQDIKLWIVERMDGGLTARSMKRKLSALHSYYKFLLKTDSIKQDVTRRIITPKITKPLPAFFKDKEMSDAEREIQILQDGADFVKARNNLIIELLYQTGIRRAEALGLKISDIDTESMQIRVFGKRRKQRIIPIGGQLLDYINQYLQLREQCFSEDQTDILLLSDKGKPMSNKQITQVVKLIMGEVSSLRKISPHVLRHTFATTMLNNGADINTIKQLLGHSSLAATQVYTHTTFEQIQSAYKNSHPRAI